MMLFILTAVVWVHFPPYFYFQPPLFSLHVDFYFVHLLLVIHINGSYCLENEMPKILGILETNNIAFFPFQPYATFTWLSGKRLELLAWTKRSCMVLSLPVSPAASHTSIPFLSTFLTDAQTHHAPSSTLHLKIRFCWLSLSFSGFISRYHLDLSSNGTSSVSTEEPLLPITNNLFSDTIFVSNWWGSNPVCKFTFTSLSFPTSL